MYNLHNPVSLENMTVETFVQNYIMLFLAHLQHFQSKSLFFFMKQMNMNRAFFCVSWQFINELGVRRVA